MITYKTGKPNTKRYILYELLGAVGLVLILLICQYMFPEYRAFKNPNYLLWAIVLPSRLFFEIKRERVYEISFDHEKQMISFLYKTWAFSKLKKYDLPYEVARVERNENTGFVNWFGPAPIYFSKNKLDLFDISRSNDGFTKETLNEIYKTCVEIYLAQKNLQPTS